MNLIWLFNDWSFCSQALNNNHDNYFLSCSFIRASCQRAWGAAQTLQNTVQIEHNKIKHKKRKSNEIFRKPCMILTTERLFSNTRNFKAKITANTEGFLWGSCYQPYQIHLTTADETFVRFPRAGIFKILSSFSFKIFWDCFCFVCNPENLSFLIPAEHNMVVSGHHL